jgi:ubiquinone/menaquinone biosynthesis C-methylase UbiE
MQTHTPTASDGWQLDGSAAEAYEQYLASAFTPWADALVALAQPGTHDRILDVGCGTGIVARRAALQAPDAVRIVGLDINEDMLRVARASSRAMRPAVEWDRGDAVALPYDDGSFDVVLCEQALQFVSEPARAVSEMFRVLAPGGRAALSVCRPIQHSPTYEVLAAVLDRHVDPQAGAIMRSPFSVWSVDDLRALVTRAPFGTVRVRIEAGALRYTSPAEFLRHEAASSPLSNRIRALDAGRRERLLTDLSDSLHDWVDDDGIACLVESYVVLARRAA